VGLGPWRGALGGRCARSSEGAHERSGGALRFAIDSDASGNIRLRVLPKRSWVGPATPARAQWHAGKGNQRSKSAEQSPGKKPADHDVAEPSTATPRLHFIPKKSSVSTASKESTGTAKSAWWKQSCKTASNWQDTWNDRSAKHWGSGSNSDWRWQKKGRRKSHEGQRQSIEVSSSSDFADDGEQSQSGSTQQLLPRQPSHSPPPRRRPSSPERPQQPPGKHWDKFQDDGQMWWFYDGPLGQWWKPEGSEDILQYEDRGEAAEECGGSW